MIIKSMIRALDHGDGTYTLAPKSVSATAEPEIFGRIRKHHLTPLDELMRPYTHVASFPNYDFDQHAFSDDATVLVEAELDSCLPSCGCRCHEA